MSHDMPKEIWAWQEQSTGIVYWSGNKNDKAAPYTLTYHHTAEIAKRDRAIEVLMRYVEWQSIGRDNAGAVLKEAQAILNGE